MTWDFAESNPINNSPGGFSSSVEWVSEVIDHALSAVSASPPTSCVKESAVKNVYTKYDAIVTDPPYYDAIPYSDLMDFFYVWIRRVMYGSSEVYDTAFVDSVGPNWNEAETDGELVAQPG